MGERLANGKGSVGALLIRGATATGAAGASTLNAAAGVVTTEALATAAGGTYTHTMTNGAIRAGDIVLASVNTAGTGMPALCKTAVTDGQAVFVIQNVHASAAFSAALTIGFAVISQR